MSDTRTFVRFHNNPDTGKPDDLNFGWCEITYKPTEGFEEFISLDTRRSKPAERELVLKAMNRLYVAVYDEWTGYVKVLIERVK